MRRLAAAAALLWAGSALAGPFDLFGYGPHGIAMGGAMTAAVDDYSATFYNPGALTLNPDISIGLGFASESPRLHVDFDDPSKGSCDASAPGVHAHCGDSYSGYWVGVLFPLAGKVKNRVAIGVTAYLPSSDIIRTEAVDQSEPQFYLYQSSPDRISVVAALAVKIVDREEWRLSVGAGAQALADFDGAIDFDVDIFAKSFNKRSLRNDLKTHTAPVAGVIATVGDAWRFGASWRGTLSLPFAMPTNIGLTDLGTLTLDVRGVAHWTPHVFTLGAAWSPAPDWQLSADLDYELWSQAPKPQVQVAVGLNGPVLNSLGLSGALDMRTNDPPPGLRDILYPRLGALYRFAPSFEVRAGYVYRPTMVPNQIYDSNFLDSSSHILSAGVGYAFSDPLEVFQAPVRLDVSIQDTHLTQTRVQKSSAQSPTGDYTFYGDVVHFAVALRYDF